MNRESITQDERTVAVENASFRIGYQILAFGILLEVMVRTIALRQQTWDLFALLLLSGAVMRMQQARARVTPRHGPRTMLLSAVAAALLVFGIALYYRLRP